MSKTTNSGDVSPELAREFKKARTLERICVFLIVLLGALVLIEELI
jgi:hypothetical protein